MTGIMVMILVGEETGDILEHSEQRVVVVVPGIQIISIVEVRNIFITRGSVIRTQSDNRYCRIPTPSKIPTLLRSE